MNTASTGTARGAAPAERVGDVVRARRERRAKSTITASTRVGRRHRAPARSRLERAARHVDAASTARGPPAGGARAAHASRTPSGSRGPAARARVGALRCAGPAGVRHDRDPVAARQRLAGQQRREVEHLGQRVGADHARVGNSASTWYVGRGEQRARVRRAPRAGAAGARALLTAIDRLGGGDARAPPARTGAGCRTTRGRAARRPCRRRAPSTAGSRCPTGPPCRPSTRTTRARRRAAAAGRAPRSRTRRSATRRRPRPARGGSGANVALSATRRVGVDHAEAVRPDEPHAARAAGREQLRAGSAGSASPRAGPRAPARRRARRTRAPPRATLGAGEREHGELDRPGTVGDRRRGRDAGRASPRAAPRAARRRSRRREVAEHRRADRAGRRRRRRDDHRRRAQDVPDRRDRRVALARLEPPPALRSRRRREARRAARPARAHLDREARVAEDADHPVVAGHASTAANTPMPSAARGARRDGRAASSRARAPATSPSIANATSASPGPAAHVHRVADDALRRAA